MKTLAILALCLSFAACAADDNSGDDSQPPLPKASPQGEAADINETVDIGEPQPSPLNLFGDGRVEWAETIGDITYLHSIDGRSGIDTISVLDEH